MISLEKYKGNKTRFTCPSCNGKKEFTRYKDEDGSYLGENVGKCNRLNKCGYHYPPKQFFADNPELRKKGKKKPLARGKKPSPRAKVIKQPKTDFIDTSVLISSLTDYEDNAFVQFLMELFPDNVEAVIEAVRKYFIGTWQKQRTIFWQIDKNRRIRTGKLISYDASTGKRLKGIKPSYIHAELKRLGKSSSDFQLKQCLFGEHLLSDERHKTVAIVEAEKTAVIASIMFPKMVWLAAGAKSYLKVEKLEKVGSRNIILYPDADSFESWSQIAEEAVKIGMNVKVSTLIEQNASDAEKEEGNDLADYLIEEQRRKNRLKDKDYLLGLLPDEILADENLFSDFEMIFEERVAILEYVEGLSGAEAEKAAIQYPSLERIINTVLLEENPEVLD